MDGRKPSESNVPDNQANALTPTTQSKINLESLRDSLSNLDLAETSESIEAKLNHCQESRLQLETLHDKITADLKVLQAIFNSILEVSEKVEKENGDPKKVLPRRNMKITQQFQKVVDFLHAETDPLKNLPFQEATRKLDGLLNRHLVLNEGKIQKIDSGCFEQFFGITSRSFSHVIDVSGVHWQLVLECSQTNGLIVIEPFLMCLGLPGKTVGRKEHFRMFAQVRGNLEISIHYEEEFSQDEYFDFTQEKRIQFSGHVVHRKLPVMKFPDAALGAPATRSQGVNQWSLKCYIFVNEPVFETQCPNAAS